MHVPGIVNNRKNPSSSQDDRTQSSIPDVYGALYLDEVERRTDRF